MEANDLDNFAIVPTLYYDTLSSHARSCQMLIKKLKIDVDLQSTDSMIDMNFDETHTWINSFCKLPILVDGCVTLCNGHSILIYLCRKYAPKNLKSLCPCDYITRQKLTSMLYFEACILHRCLSHLLADIYLAKYPNFNVDYHKSKVSNMYNSLDTYLDGHLFMIENYLTIADISIVSTVSALNIIFPIDYEKYQKLFDWFQRLKKMEFYMCNEEGLHKFRLMLKKVGKFPIPTPFSTATKDTELKSDNDLNEENNEMQIINANTYELNDKHEVEKSKTKADKNYVAETLPKPSGAVSGNKNSKNKHEPETFNFYDTYFINVSKCSSCTDQRTKTSSHQEVFESVKETSEIYKRPEALEYLSSTDDAFEEPEHSFSHHFTALEKNEGIEQDEYCCSCNKEFCKNKKGWHSVKKNKYNWESTKNVSKNLRENNYKEREHDLTLGGESCKITVNKNKNGGKNKVKDTEHENFSLLSDKTKSTETCEYNSTRKPGCNELTRQEVQALVAKVHKLEQILNMSDKNLKCKSSILSNSSSIDSRIKENTKIPHKCSAENCPCHRKFDRCDCRKKPKRSSIVEALEFDEDTDITMPEFLVTSEPECSKLGTQKCKRLKGGRNFKPRKTESFIVNFPIAHGNKIFRNEQLEDKVLKALLLAMAKAVCMCPVKTGCNECCNKIKNFKSKIPRLVSHKSLINTQVYEISKKKLQ